PATTAKSWGEIEPGVYIITNEKAHTTLHVNQPESPISVYASPGNPGPLGLWRVTIDEDSGSYVISNDYFGCATFIDPETVRLYTIYCGGRDPEKYTIRPASAYDRTLYSIRAFDKGNSVWGVDKFNPVYSNVYLREEVRGLEEQWRLTKVDVPN
ncbi:hypothetical protein C8R46DRAFT_1059864, partial [Mycena filopes]